jgi:hypothetical protein
MQPLGPTSSCKYIVVDDELVDDVPVGDELVGDE